MSERTQNRMNVTSVAPITPVPSGMLQRKCDSGNHTMGGGECEACGKKREGMLQRKTADSAKVSEVPSIVHEVLRSPGQQLDPATRAFFEPRFGQDFSQVRVHTDAKAAKSAHAVNALAYTVGRDVFFGAGQYAPSKPQGQKLLAHELTHVMQQRNAALASQASLSQPGDAFEQEADRIADDVTASRRVRSRSPSLSGFNDSTLAQKIWRMSDKSLPVPRWSQLPDYAQAALVPKGYDEKWFNEHDDVLRLTVLDLYVKLSGLGLWNYVGSEDSTGPGTLEFISSDVKGFKTTLRSRDDFTSPEESMEEWSSREMKASGSLHVKHFKGWPEAKVQTHIDQHGLLLASKWWWLLPVVPLMQMLIHGLTHESYKDVYGIRDLLLAEGWDPSPLKGVGVTTIQRKEGSPGEPKHEEPKVKGHQAAEAPPIVHEALRSLGQPLDAETQAFMEPRFGHDFSNVRIHTNTKAAESARAVNALAYTVGREVVFGAGQYVPVTQPGRRLLARELTHVVQQQNDAMRSHHIMKKEPQNTPPKTPPPTPAAKVNECEPAQPLTWGDYSDKVPQGATYEANTGTRIKFISAHNMFQCTLDSANVWAMPQAKNAADNAKNGCQEKIEACEDWIDKNPGKTGHNEPPAQRKCPASVIPKRVEFKTKKECTTIFGEECKKAKIADAKLLLKHEQLHFAVSCILVNKANQALKAGKDFDDITKSLDAKWRKLIVDYDTETKHRCDQAKQDEWQKKVDQGLPKVTIP